MDQDKAQYIKMTERPVGPLIASLAVPTIVSMMVTSIYNMADTFFVSKLGTSASGAVGIVFSLMAIIQAVGFTVGMGSGSWISRLLGEKKTDEAGKVAASGLGLAIFFGLGLSAAGLSNLDSLMRVLGASSTILPYARAYASYILLAAPVMSASFVLNNVLRAEGKAKFAMFGIGTGGILNLALDPLFIFVFDLGIGGAAIATALSQCVSFLILLAVFLNGKTIVKIRPKSISKEAETYLNILTFGLPSLSRQGLASVSSILLNTSASVYGDAAVAAMAITSKIFMFIFSITLGIGQGYMPVLGYNYGARKFDRVRRAFSFTLKINTLIISVLALGGFFAAESLIRFFIAADPEVIRIGSTAFRFLCMSMPLISLGVVCNMTFQSLGKAWTATMLATLRQGICLIPLIILLPRFLGLRGIQLAQPSADLLTFLCCIPFTVHFFRLLEREEKMGA
jgi:putative MATE family efflux protein